MPCLFPFLLCVGLCKMSGQSTDAGRSFMCTRSEQLCWPTLDLRANSRSLIAESAEQSIAKNADAPNYNVIASTHVALVSVVNVLAIVYMRFPLVAMCQRTSTGLPFVTTSSTAALGSVLISQPEFPIWGTVLERQAPEHDANDALSSLLVNPRVSVQELIKSLPPKPCCDYLMSHFFRTISSLFPFSTAQCSRSNM